MRPCAPTLPSSRSACRRRNRLSTLGKTEMVQNQETAQTRWKSIPTHSPACRRCRKRSDPRETRSPAWGPSPESRNCRTSDCRTWHWALRFPMDRDKDESFRIHPPRRTRRDATPLPWGATSPPTERMRLLPHGSHRRASRTAAVLRRTSSGRANDLPAFFQNAG